MVPNSKNIFLLLVLINRGVILVWNKLLAISFITFFPEIHRKAQLVLLLLIVYSFLHNKIQPNLSKKLNQTETISNMLLLFILWCKTLVYAMQKENNAQFFELLILIFENISILILILFLILPFLSLRVSGLIKGKNHPSLNKALAKGLFSFKKIN